MGLDLGFYNVKSKINNIDEYYEKTRTEVFESLNRDYDKFYKFEEFIPNNLEDDWNIIFLLNTAITSLKTDGIDYSSEYDAKILTKKDIEDTINFLNHDNIATKVLGLKNLVDRETGLPINVEEYYPKSYWDNIQVEFKKILNQFDFNNNTLLLSYSY